MNRILLLLLPFLLFACEDATTTVAPPAQEPELKELDCGQSPELCAFNVSNNAFGFRLMRELHREQPDENIFISPLSISTALSMTANGANGQTFEEMMSTLGYADFSLEAVNQHYELLLGNLPVMDQDVDVGLANSIWYRENYPVLPNFLEVNQTHFDSEVREADFSDPATKDAINGWVNDKTKGLIDKIIEKIPGNVVMYLLNAIYFKGSWKQEFDPERTQEAPFFLADGRQKSVDMMHNGGIWLPYLETEQYQAVDLAYGDSIYSMSLILPKEGNSLGTLITQMENRDWQEWANGFETDSIYFAMPKFEMKYEKELKGPLTELGMGRIFNSGAADFSSMVAGGGVWVDKVKHKSFIQVDEKGAEAAAVTSVVVVESTPDIPFAVFNEPFLFVIRENRTGAVLFVGKMMDPGAA